jgi:M6 family metalloprotease-like protein
LLIACWLLIAASTRAAHLSGVPHSLKQPDGSVIEVFTSGDEDYSWLHDRQGFVIVRDEHSGFFVYADKVDGYLVATTVRPGRDDPSGHGLVPQLMPDPELIPGCRSAALYHPLPQQHAKSRQGTYFPCVNNLVVFIRFADEPEYELRLSDVEAVFKGSDSSQASLHGYFEEASYGQTEVTSHFFQGSGDSIVSYQDPHPRIYYTSLYGQANYEMRERHRALVENALLTIAGQVPAELELDSNGDGYIDNVTFIFQGPGRGSILFPQASFFHGSQVTINGARLLAINMQSAEWLTVRVLAHELLHSLGAPDNYHKSFCSSDARNEPTLLWDIMSSTYDPPPHPPAYTKQRYTGWISEIPEITVSGTYSLQPLTTPFNNAYRIASPNTAGEYFVLEYRRAEGTYESQLPGSGLLVYRVNPSLNGNFCGPPDELYLYRPGGSPSEPGDLQQAHLSSDVARTGLSDRSDPPPFLTWGETGGLVIRDIGPAGDTITFTVDIQAPCHESFELLSPADGIRFENDQATLEWTDVPGATFDVYFGDSPFPARVGSTADTSWTLTDLEPGPHHWRVSATTDTCIISSPPSETRLLPVYIGVQALSNGVPFPIRMMEIDPDRWKYYSIEVPPGAARLEISADATNYLNIYLRHGAVPSLLSHDQHARLTEPGNRISLDHPAPGTWYIGIHAWWPLDGTTLRAEYELMPAPRRGGVRRPK